MGRPSGVAPGTRGPGPPRARGHETCWVAKGREVPRAGGHEAPWAAECREGRRASAVKWAASEPATCRDRTAPAERTGAHARRGSGQARVRSPANAAAARATGGNRFYADAGVSTAWGRSSERKPSGRKRGKEGGRAEGGLPEEEHDGACPEIEPSAGGQIRRPATTRVARAVNARSRPGPSDREGQQHRHVGHGPGAQRTVEARAGAAPASSRRAAGTTAPAPTATSASATKRPSHCSASA